VEQAVPGLRVDRDRLYLVGSSMGGQEALLALSRAPDRFAAAAVFDGAADLAARYRDMGLAGQLRDQSKLRRELGGTPARRRFAYAQRSPLAVAPTLALCGVPLCVGWSTADEIVTRGAETQFGRLCRRLRVLAPSLPLREVVTALPHGNGIKDTPAIAEFLAPGGVWRTRGTEAPERWVYRGWQTRVDVWDGTIEAPGSTGSGWWRVEVAGATVTVESSAYLRIAIPWPGGDAPVTVEMNGRERRVWPRDGLLRLSFLAGSSTAVIRRP
jgi:pimeloyl-ACP methyl ester carboxylesterase